MALVGGIFYEYVMYSKGIAGAKYKKYDFGTCTAGDYSVRMDIPEKWYKEFREKNAARVANGKKVRDIEMFL
jgi:hypothetical protein